MNELCGKAKQLLCSDENIICLRDIATLSNFLSNLIYQKKMIEKTMRFAPSCCYVILKNEYCKH